MYRPGTIEKDHDHRDIGRPTVVEKVCDMPPASPRLHPVGICASSASRVLRSS